MNNARTYVKKNREGELKETFDKKVHDLIEKGYLVEFGKIGTRTTYALLTNQEYDKEIVGYTYIKNKQYMNELVGKLKALDQAIARKEILETRE